MQPTLLAEKKLPGIVACEHDMLDLVSEMVWARGSQKAVALELGISTTHLGDILRGKKSIGPHVAGKLGWERVTVFRKKGMPEDGGALPVQMCASAEQDIAQHLEEDKSPLRRFLRKFRKS